jgi:hypothetical protein
LLSVTHPVQLQIAPELGPVSCVELVETDADHDQSDQPEKDRAEWGLESHGARRHGVFLVGVHDPLYQVPQRIPDESGGQDDEQYSALGLRPHVLHRAAWPCGRAAQP